MGANDFDRQDAEDAARTEIQLQLRRYTRRLKAKALAKIQLSDEQNLEVGRAAALDAIEEQLKSYAALAPGDDE